MEMSRLDHRPSSVAASSILEESVGELPTLTAQDPLDLQDALINDCRPPLLPVSLRLDDIGPLPLRRTVVSASLAAPPQEDFMEIGGVSPEGVAVPELGVATLVDTDTEPVEVFPVAPSTYPEPPVPVLLYDDPDATPSLQEDADCRPPPSPATMDQYLSRDGDLLLGDAVDLPLLSMPLTPRPVVVDMVPESSVGSPAGVPVVPPSDGMPDLSREGPFDVHQDALESGSTPQVLDSLPGCQYRMASYDDDVDRSDLNPAYGFHLHDPLLLEYVGAPESARLLSRTPEYWLHHMGRDRAMAAALQLQHDAGLILSRPVCDVVEQTVVGGDAGGVRSQTVSDGSRPLCGAVSSNLMGGSLHGCHGVVASTEYPGCSWTPAVVLKLA